jgi:hypothetical protein
MSEFYGIDPNEAPASVVKTDGMYVAFDSLPDETRAAYFDLMRHLRDLNDDKEAPSAPNTLRAVVVFIYEQILTGRAWTADLFQLPGSFSAPSVRRRVAMLFDDLPAYAQRDSDAFRGAITHLALAMKDASSAEE